MKIAHIASGFYPDWYPAKGYGGIEQYTWYVTLELRKLGVESYLLNNNNTLIETLKQIKPDIIHYHTENFFYIFQNNIKTSAKKVFTCHVGRDIINNPMPATDPALIAARNEETVVSTDSNFSNLIGPRKNLFLIGNGCNEEVFKPDIKKANTFVCLGKHEYRKKFAEISHVFSKFPLYTLYIIGPSDEDTVNISKASNIKIVGEIDETSLAYNLGKIETGIHIAQAEMGVPSAVRSILSCGCNLLCSSVLHKHLQNDGGNILPVDNAEQLYDVLSKYEAFRNRPIIKKYRRDWSIVAKELLSVYNQIL